jgi:PAS domain-containing protein
MLRATSRYGAAADIEDRKRTEQALRRSERELRDLIETMPAMAVAALREPVATSSRSNVGWRFDFQQKAVALRHQRHKLSRFRPSPRERDMSAKYLEDIIHRRAENDARIIVEDQRPQGNDYRGVSFESFKVPAHRESDRADPDEYFNVTLADKIALKMQIRKWTEHGQQPFPFIDEHRPSFCEFFHVDLREVLHWPVDQYLELCTKWPDAGALLVIELRDEIIKAVQQKYCPTTVTELRDKVLEIARSRVVA